MINRKTMLAGGIAAAIFSISSVSAATLQNGNVSSASQPSFNVPAGSTVLFDQTSNQSTSGVTVQNFSSSYDAYDGEAADDFVVPASGWTVSSVNMITSTSDGFTGATTASVNFYPDAAGIPGSAPACSYPAVPATVAADSTSITLPTTCVLAAGTYWVAVSIDLDFATGGQIFWTNDTVGALSDAVFRNPGDGFGSGCIDWGTFAACDIGGGIDPGLSFQLLGAVGGGVIPPPPAPTLPVPTMSQWSVLLAAGGLALLGLFGLRRRARR